MVKLRASFITIVYMLCRFSLAEGETKGPGLVWLHMHRAPVEPHDVFVGQKPADLRAPLRKPSMPSRSLPSTSTPMALFPHQVYHEVRIRIC